MAESENNVSGPSGRAPTRLALLAGIAVLEADRDRRLRGREAANGTLRVPRAVERGYATA